MFNSMSTLSVLIFIGIIFNTYAGAMETRKCSRMPLDHSRTEEVVSYQLSGNIPLRQGVITSIEINQEPRQQGESGDAQEQLCSVDTPSSLAIQQSFSPHESQEERNPMVRLYSLFQRRKH